MATPRKPNGNGRPRWRSLAVRNEIYEKLSKEAKRTGESAQSIANKKLGRSLHVGKLA